MNNVYDITTFMTWFLNQIVGIMTYTYQTLDNIKIGNASLFRIILMITIIKAFMDLTLTVPKGLIPKQERKIEKNDREHK